MRFPLSEGMDVESLSGASVSHWTESTVQDVRWVTVHLKDKTLGKITLDMTLSGPGPSPGSTWVVPSVRFESASRQEGQLTVSSEQGMRLQAAQKEGVVQLDPETLGMSDRDAMVFRLHTKIGIWRLRSPSWRHGSGRWFSVFPDVRCTR